MRLEWSEESLRRLCEIEAFIASDSPDRAREFINHLISNAGLLPDNPELGRTVPEFGDPSLRELIVKKYRIVYKHEKHRIVIITVFEGGRLLTLDAMEFDE